MNEVRIRKRLNRIKRKIKSEEMIKEKKGKIKNMEYCLVFYEFINFDDLI